MITTRKLSIALCATLLLAPLGLLTAQTHDDTGGFYLGASYGVALPAERDVTYDTTMRGTSQMSTYAIQTDFGFLGGQIDVGYAISGFRVGISAGYRTVSMSSFYFKEFVGETSDEALKSLNDLLKEAFDAGDITGSIRSLEFAANVYYDIDTGTAIVPYVGGGGGMSNVAVEFLGQIESPFDDSLWTFAFQGAAGVGYAASEQITVSLGYRLTGVTGGEFSKVKQELEFSLIHIAEAGIRFRF